MKKEGWSVGRQPNMDNFQAMAYAGLAMKNKGFTQEQISKVLREMWVLFDEMTEEEAEERWKEEV